jgi:hypothetical protein
MLAGRIEDYTIVGDMQSVALAGNTPQRSATSRWCRQPST